MVLHARGVEPGSQNSEGLLRPISRHYMAMRNFISYVVVEKSIPNFSLFCMGKKVVGSCGWPVATVPSLFCSQVGSVPYVNGIRRSIKTKKQKYKQKDFEARVDPDLNRGP